MAPFLYKSEYKSGELTIEYICNIIVFVFGEFNCLLQLYIDIEHEYL